MFNPSLVQNDFIFEYGGSTLHELYNFSLPLAIFGANIRHSTTRHIFLQPNIGY